MTKKNVMMTLACILVAIALGAMLWFVFSGDTPAEPEAPAVDLNGTWKVASYVQAGTAVLPEQQFFVFSGDKAYAYKDNTAEPLASSAFELSMTSTYADMVLSLPDISREYNVKFYTENYIRLYENNQVYMELIRYGNDDMSPVAFDEKVVEGQWVVVYRNTSEVITEEKIHFADGMLTDYRNGAAEPVAVVPYYWNADGCICVDALNTEMYCYPLSENVIFFIERSTGFVWELHTEA